MRWGWIGFSLGAALQVGLHVGRDVGVGHPRGERADGNEVGIGRVAPGRIDRGVDLRKGRATGKGQGE